MGIPLVSAHDREVCKDRGLVTLTQIPLTQRVSTSEVLGVNLDFSSGALF